MSLGLIGRKIGMTRLFTEEGRSLPVTVLDVSNNRITQIRTHDHDGYSALQITFGSRRSKSVTKPLAGHFAKAGVAAGVIVREFLVKELADYKLGETLAPNIFLVGQKVDVSGFSQGKGFAGAIKRHNFSSNRASHGNSVSHNKVGSIGMNQDPGRVFPGKKMAGHMGSVRRTMQNLEVLRVDVDRQLLLVKGAVPGSKGSSVMIRPSVKMSAADIN